MKKFYSLFFSCWFIVVAVKAQPPKKALITVDAQGVTIEELVKQVEQQSDYIFYYNPVQFDSFSVNVIARKLPLDEILQFVFRNTDFFASIDTNKHVFLTKGQPIQTGLFFEANKRKSDSLRRVGQFVGNKDSNAKKVFPESKIFEIGIKTNHIVP